MNAPEEKLTHSFGGERICYHCLGVVSFTDGKVLDGLGDMTSPTVFAELLSMEQTLKTARIC
jgi:hypothetical protein